MSSSTTTSRCVSFYERATVTLVPAIEEYSLEEKALIWYSCEDYASFKAELNRKAKAVRAHFGLFKRELERAFGSCHARVIENLESLPPRQQMGIKKWCEFSDCRGLEKWSSKDIRMAREIARDEVSRLVAISRHVDGEELRDRYVEISRSYCDFARIIAEADMVTLKMIIEAGEKFSSCNTSYGCTFLDDEGNKALQVSSVLNSLPTSCKSNAIPPPPSISPVMSFCSTSVSCSFRTGDDLEPTY